MATLRDLMNLHGRRILITGAAGWLGRTMADTLAELGATVLLVDRDANTLARVADDLRSRWTVDALCYQTDLEEHIDRLIALCAIQVFADSYSQCRFLEDEGVVQRGGVTVLGQGSVAGVDLARFRPDPAARAALRAETGVTDTVPVFLFVGRLVRDKGVFDLVKAFAALSDLHGHWELWMVGPDEDGLQTTLQAEGERLGGRIRWFGPTPMPERYMAAADVFVLPSYREGFGSVIIEAAACGVPSIAYRIDGVIDAIVDGRTGLFVDKGDVQGLSDAMNRLGAESRTRKTLGEAAHLRASSEFSSASVSAAWLDFYSSVLRGEA